MDDNTKVMICAILAIAAGVIAIVGAMVFDSYNISQQKIEQTKALAAVLKETVKQSPEEADRVADKVSFLIESIRKEK